MNRESIAFLLDSAPGVWTSQEDRHLRLCEALRQRGVRPILIFSAALRADIQARLRAAGAEIEAIDYGKGAVRYYGELRSLARRFNIGTAHIVFFDYFSALPWIARMCGIRHVIYEMQNSGELRAVSWKKRLLLVRTRAMTRPIGTVIAISRFVKEQLVSAGLPENKIRVRYLGVDVERFRPDPEARRHWERRFGIGSDEVILSTVSYLRPFKHPQVLVAACQTLQARGVPVRLLVGGDGDMLPGLKALAQEVGVAERVHWLGNVADPVTLLQGSDVFLLASVGEAFGLVLAEAMACGLPVVGSRSGSIPEVVEDGRTGQLATARDPVSFADAIERLAGDVRLRRQMGAAAVARVRTHFTVDIAVERTLQIYESVWSGHLGGA